MNEKWSKDISEEAEKVLEKLPLDSFYPPRELVFSMFSMPPESIKVLIMGQDPYPNNMACGPAFVVPRGVDKCPQSLITLFQELKTDIGLSKRDMRSCMNNWMNQGVFLTNCSLTIGKENDYLKDHSILWTVFTTRFLKSIKGCVVVLLGTEAWKFDKFVAKENEVLKYYHPTNRSNKFIGSKMFSSINSLLENPISWN